jgi:tetratricopeptide (TPR) repeat protein
MSLFPIREQIGPFDLRSILGRGGGGEVWLGVHLPSGTEVVLKRPLQGERIASERLDREIVASSRLQHPCVVRVLDARRARGTEAPYLVLAWAQRGSLAQHRLGEAPEGLLQALLDALAGLSHLHARGLLHLDLKPANLFVADTSRGVRVQIGDLGSAIPRWGLGAPEVRSLAGTTGFMAPELRSGDLSSLGPWTDLWSLGATARALLPDAPPWLASWIDRCTALAPADRFPSAGQAALALRSSPLTPSRLDLARFTERPRGVFSFLGSTSTLLTGQSTAPFDLPLAPPPAAPSAPEPPPPPLDLAPPPLDIDASEELELPPGLGAGAVGVRRPPLVGRSAIQERLAAAWTRARAGQGGFWILEGASGSGLTRMGEWCAELALQDGGVSFEVRLGEGGSGLGGALRRWALGAGWGGAQRGAEHVQRRLAAEGLNDLADELGPGLLALLEGKTLPGARLASLLERLLQGLRRQRPVLLLVDALDEARGAMAWLEGVVAQLASRRGVEAGAMVLATQARPGRGPGAEALRLEPGLQGQVIPVPPLDRFACERLASRLLGFTDASSQQVAARSGGLPGVLVEHVAAWVREGVLVAGEHGLALAPGAAPPVPSSLANRLRRRIEGALGATSPELRLALAACALLDGAPAAPVLRALQLPETLPFATLQRAGLVVGPPERWRWAAPGVGDALLEGEPRAAELRAACARSLDPGGPLPGALAARLAQLWSQAGDPPLALDVASRVIQVDLNPDAARSLLETLDPVEFPDSERETLRTGLCARLHFERGDHEAARRAAMICLERGGGEGRRWRQARMHALHTMALIGSTEGQALGALLPLAREAARWAEELGPDERAASWLLEGRLLVMGGRAQELVTGLRGRLEEPGAVSEPTRWRCWMLLADACTRVGQPELAVSLCRRATEAMEQAGGHWLLGNAYNTLADAFMQQQRYEEALPVLHGALDELYPRSPVAGYVRANLAFCQLMLGQRERAAFWIEEAQARLPVSSRHRLWCLLQSLRLPLLAAPGGELEALDACCTELEAWLDGQRTVHNEPALAATMAAEALAPRDPGRSARLFSLARRFAAHLEDEDVLAALRRRWPPG